MRQHTRMDGIKIFATDDANLSIIKADFGIKTNSEGWRKAAQEYVDKRPGSKVLQELRDTVASNNVEIQELKSLVQDLYFMVRKSMENTNEKRTKKRLD